MPRWISCPLADFEQREQCSLIERYCPGITSHSPYNLVNQSLSPSSTEPFHSLYRVRVVAKKNISQRRYESAAVYDEMQVWVNEEKSAWERRTDWWERRVRQRDGAVDRKRRLRQHTHTHTHYSTTPRRSHPIKRNISPTTLCLGISSAISLALASHLTFARHSLSFFFYLRFSFATRCRPRTLFSCCVHCIFISPLPMPCFPTPGVVFPQQR